MKDLLGSMIYWEALVTYGGAPLVCSLLGMITCWEVCLVIVTYEEVFSNVWSIGENSSFSLGLTGELMLILPTRGSCQLYREISSQLMGGYLLCLGSAGESFCNTILF